MTRAILILVIALMLIFTSGCDSKKGKDKSKEKNIIGLQSVTE